MPLCLSTTPMVGNIIKDPVILIQQFYIDQNENRQKEIRECLRINANNPAITRIILINERQYTSVELGIQSNKITQIINNSRLRFSTVFHYVKYHIKNAYIILSNSDILFDESINNIFNKTIHTDRSMMCQSRFEYNNISAPYFVSKPFSQDAWIWHTASLNLSIKEISLFDFPLGKPGCDNRVVYLCSIIGIKSYNCPYMVNIYHHHASMVRGYTSKDIIGGPHMGIYPDLGVNRKIGITYNWPIDSDRFAQLISNTDISNKAFSIINLVNKESIIATELINMISKSPKEVHRALVYANSNNMNFINNTHMNEFLINFKLSLQNSIGKFTSNPSSREVNIKGALTALHSHTRGENMFDAAILNYNISKYSKWTNAIKHYYIYIISPSASIYNTQYDKDNSYIKNKHMIFIHYDIHNDFNSIITHIVNTIAITSKGIDNNNIIALLGTELYDNYLSTILLNKGISSICVGTYLDSYFKCLSKEIQYNNIPIKSMVEDEDAWHQL